MRTWSEVTTINVTGCSLCNWVWCIGKSYSTTNVFNKPVNYKRLLLDQGDNLLRENKTTVEPPLTTRGVLAMKFHKAIFSEKHSTKSKSHISFVTFFPNSNVKEMKRFHLIDTLESLETKVHNNNYMSCLPGSERWSVWNYIVERWQDLGIYRLPWLYCSSVRLWFWLLSVDFLHGTSETRNRSLDMCWEVHDIVMQSGAYLDLFSRRPYYPKAD